jgi:hypothetical protein
MIHYHGLPITPGTAALAAIKRGHAFVSYAHKDQLGIAIDNCQTFAIDNGAFSAWTSGKPITDWTPFLEWAEEISYLPHCDFIVIPDQIDGCLNDQTALIGKFLQHFGSRGTRVGCPVYHLHEPLEHAGYLSRAWPRVSIGSSGDYAQIGTPKWWNRMNQVMKAMCDERGRPNCKIHGLRMLDPEIFTRFPFSSADSTNIGRNIGIDSKWKGTYLPPNKDVRALVMREKIESFNSANTWDSQPVQMELVA